MNEKLLSVIIPVYNTSKALDACLQSVLTQDYRNLEILCVDDGSTDSSPEILERYASEDQRIRIFRHEKNRGLLNARRTGVEAAHGDFIQFLDSDDTVDPGLFSSAMDAIQTENADIVQFSARQNYLNSRKKFIIEAPSERYMGDEILENIFATRKVSTSLVVKICRTEICKSAYKAIPNVHCYVGEDILTSFFIAYYSSSYRGIKTKAKYNYFFGSGVSSETEMKLEKFRLYCEMNIFPEIIKSFLDDSHWTAMAERSLEHMTYRLISDCIKDYLMVRDSEKEAAAELFWESWSGNPYFRKAIFCAIDDLSQTISEIKNSESYKLGNAVVNPLHNLKNRVWSH